jgi:hypothetical protein
MDKLDQDEGLRDARKLTFLQVYSRKGIIGPAAEAAGVSRRTILRWREDDDAFDEACEDAYQTAVDHAEEELRKRGVEGADELILIKGSPVPKRDPRTGEPMLDDNFEPIYLTKKERSDRLLEVYMRANRAQYRDKSSVEVSGPNGGPVPTRIEVNFVDPPDWDNIEWDPETGRPKLKPDPLG